MYFKKLLLIAGTVSSVIACSTIEPQQFVGPNSKTAYSMKCSGMGRTIDACYKKSGEICPNGYNIVDRTSSVVGIPMQGGTMIAPQNSLAIECK